MDAAIRQVEVAAEVVSELPLDHDVVADADAQVARAAGLVRAGQGTAVELAAMEYHAESEHRTTRPDGTEAVFKTNGKKPAPGAPFADPCGDWAPSGAKEDALHVIVYQAAALAYFAWSTSDAPS